MTATEIAERIKELFSVEDWNRETEKAYDKFVCENAHILAISYLNLKERMLK